MAENAPPSDVQDPRDVRLCVYWEELKDRSAVPEEEDAARELASRQESDEELKAFMRRSAATYDSLVQVASALRPQGEEQAVVRGSKPNHWATYEISDRENLEAQAANEAVMTEAQRERWRFVRGVLRDSVRRPTSDELWLLWHAPQSDADIAAKQLLAGQPVQTQGGRIVDPTTRQEEPISEPTQEQLAG